MLVGLFFCTHLWGPVISTKILFQGNSSRVPWPSNYRVFYWNFLCEWFLFYNSSWYQTASFGDHIWPCARSVQMLSMHHLLQSGIGTLKKHLCSRHDALDMCTQIYVQATPLGGGGQRSDRERCGKVERPPRGVSRHPSPRRRPPCPPSLCRAGWPATPAARGASPASRSGRRPPPRYL